MPEYGVQVFRQEARLESKAKLAGHPIHPMLVVFPLGLFATSLIFDLIRLFSTNGIWSVVSEYMIGAGIVGFSLPARVSS